jgi:hypothetical protein
LTAKHDEEQTPESGFETFVEGGLFGVNHRDGFGSLLRHFESPFELGFDLTYE